MHSWGFFLETYSSFSKNGNLYKFKAIDSFPVLSSCNRLQFLMENETDVLINIIRFIFEHDAFEVSAYSTCIKEARLFKS